MASNSLLESYIDVVNENFKKMKKSFRENIFRLAKKIDSELFEFCENFLKIQHLSKKSKNFEPKIFCESKNISGNFFPFFLYFR